MPVDSSPVLLHACGGSESGAGFDLNQRGFSSSSSSMAGCIEVVIASPSARGYVFGLDAFEQMCFVFTNKCALIKLGSYSNSL